MRKIFLFSFIFQSILLLSSAFDPTFGNTSYPKYDELSYENEIQSMKLESEAFKFFKPLVGANDPIGRRVLLHAVRKGFNSFSEYLVKNYYNPNNIDLYMTLLETRKKLDPNLLYIFEKIVNLLPEDSMFLNVVSPCYLWAQDMNILYLKVKFSPKIDIPGFMEVFKLNLTLTHYDITLTGLSLNGDLPIKWHMFIKTYKNLEPEKYDMRRTEMGTVEIEIIKSPHPYFWKNLQEDMFFDPPNQYLWWDMLYQKRKEIDDALVLFESREMEREDIDEERLVKEDKKVNDVKYIRERKRLEVERYKKDLKNRGYCWDLLYEKKCLVANPLDWHAWFFV